MDDVLAVMDAVGSERAVLFGPSEGGPMAALFAATLPERCVSLILVRGLPSVARGPRSPSPARGAGRRLRQRWIDGWGSGASLNVLAPSLAQDTGFRRWWGGSSATRFARRWCGRSSTDLATRHPRLLPAIGVPTLIIHRRGDRLVDSPTARFLAAQSRAPLRRAARRRPHLLRGRRRRAPRRDRGVRHRRARHARPRPHARHGHVHRHRRLDRARGPPRRPTLADADRGPRRAVLKPDLGLPRSHDQERPATACSRRSTARRGRFAAPVSARRRAQSRRRVRAGLHTGECELAGDDWRGVTVHIGARIADLAEPTSGARLRHRPRPCGRLQHPVRVRGTQPLKGVPGEWRCSWSSRPGLT